MAEFPLQQQQENTHTHILVGEQWYWYGSGFPPCSTINHLKGSLLSGPFPPFPQSSLPQVLLAPKIQTTVKHQQERKNKRCLVALWHRREPKDRCFMVVEHFHAKKWL